MIKHLACIMDGNRRWAKKNNLDLNYAYREGVKAIQRVVEVCLENKIQVLSHINSKKYSEIHYFGDKYLPDGNDYQLLNAPNIIGHEIDDINETYNILHIRTIKDVT